MKRDKLFFLAVGFNLLLLALGLFLERHDLLRPIAICFCCVWVALMCLLFCVGIGFRYVLGLFGLIVIVAWLGDRSAEYSHDVAVLVFLGLLVVAFLVWDLPRIIRGRLRKK